MNPTWRGVRLLGLSFLAVLGLIGPLAAGAQADWTILGKTLTELGLSEETAIGVTDSEGLFLVPELNLEGKCGKLHILEGVMSKGGIGKGRMMFLECKVFSTSPLLELKSCVITNSGSLEAKVLFLIVLHGGINYVLAEPFPGSTTFTVVNFEKGTGCALPLSNEVKGTVAIEIGQKEAVEQLTKMASAGVQTLLGDSLKYGVRSAFIDGSGLVFLTGKLAGEPWGAV